MTTGQRTSQVRVGVRVRPLASKEIQQGGKTKCLSINPPASISIASHKTFTYDAVFDSQTNQDDLYDSVSSSLLDSFVDGYNATILAYGQTGSGKTYTMGSEAHTQPEGSPQVGLIPRFISDFFRKLEEKQHASDLSSLDQKADSPSSLRSENSTSSILLEHHMKASFLEVYGEDVYDLLDSDRKSLPLREDSDGGVVVAGLTDRIISNPGEALDVLHEGTNNRTTAATLMNLTSSRSHAVFTICLTQKLRGPDQVDVVSNSKFTFVDLAGSERMKKTGAEGTRAREGIKINEGLLALGNVINALGDEERMSKEKSIHVPYRQSKLTRLLQDALGGNSQTLFLACVSPSDTNVNETLSTLRYANRARNIRNAPTKNLDATTSELQRLNALTHILQSELVKARFQGGETTDDLNTIVKIDDTMMRRSDVKDYLQKVHQAASEISGVDSAPDFTFQEMIAPSSNSSSHGLPPQHGRINGSLQKLAATPHKSSDRLDESFHIDVNPDEDMAILDRLLELQQHDHEYDKEKKRESKKLQQVDGELRKEEALLLQLRESLKAYHSLKQKYEELIAEVQQLEVEKENLAQKLQKATVDPSAGNSAAIKRQLEKVELSLNRARRETLTHRQKYKAAEDQARKCQVMERKITTLKQAKANLLKKQKETAAKYKEVSEAKTKELLALKRKEKAASSRASKMKTEIQQHKSNLEKRKQYCNKLSDKLKQTETHLMKLLSTRQRDLLEKASFVKKSGKGAVSENLSNEGFDKKLELLSNEHAKSIRFVTDKMISEKVEYEILKAQYNDRLAEYSINMREVVASVKLLREDEGKMLDDSLEGRSIDDVKDNIAQLELKLELLDSEIKEMESMLPDEGKLSRDEEAVKKMMSKFPASVMKNMLIESYNRIVGSEMEKRKNEDILIRKDAVISSLESELDLLSGKVKTLTNDLASRNIILESGENVLDLLDNAKKENQRLLDQLTKFQSQNTSFQTSIASLKGEMSSQQVELSNTKDKLVLTEAVLADLHGSTSAQETLAQLQTLWDTLGVDINTRSRVRDEIENCVSNTCSDHLLSTSQLKTRTEDELGKLRVKYDEMKDALGINQAVSPPTDKGLLQIHESLKTQVETLEESYLNANARREQIISDMISLSSTLGIVKQDLPENLLALMGQIEEQNPSKSTIGRLRRASIMENVQAMVDTLSKNLHEKRTSENSEMMVLSDHHLPPGSLDENFLRLCEKEISTLRVKKSEMMVHNREQLQKIREIVQDLHSTIPELLALVKTSWEAQGNTVPIWWDDSVAAKILKASSLSSPRLESEVTDSRFMDLIQQRLSDVANSRNLLSCTLRNIVENAQKTLLDIVGREIDASEAYASFHDALLKLPPLSIDFSHACISEMEALVSGIDAMTQSEIEALSVVWEALKVSSEERRLFWVRIDDNDVLEESQAEVNPFNKFQNITEKWIPNILSQGQHVNEDLEIKLHKLAAIHEEVERLRSKQDTKSQVLSLDSEIRILNSKLQDFEELQCSKQRLLTKKAGSAALLKEARFRKQMKMKFATKLEQLASLLRAWEHNEGRVFDASLLSNDVRMLLSEPGKMEQWIEKRTMLMPSRTIPTKGVPNKRQLEDQGANNETKEILSKRKPGLPPPRKRLAVAPKIKRKDDTIYHSKPATIRKRMIKPTSNENLQETQENVTQHTNAAPTIKRLPKVRRKDSTTLPPFGRILSELSSPDQKET